VVIRIAWLVALLVAGAVRAQVPGETITVSVSRVETRLSDTPSSVVVLDRKALDLTPALSLDDALRQVPGFTLFRRSSSRVANPTAQGVSLRGVGASGASRAIVLDDGIPLNDPFGGWVYWGRVPNAAVQRAEVLRGGASDLYGSGATGGVISLVRPRGKTPDLVFDGSAGSQGTGAFSLYTVGGSDRWNASLAAEYLATDGYAIVDDRSRGAVDRRADSAHRTADVTLRRGRTFLRGSYFEEGRNNGTALQVNDTIVRQVAAGTDVVAAGGTLLLRGYASDQDYFQTFSAIAADRSSERLTVEQKVPATSLGGTLQWSRPIARKHGLIAGVEARSVEGESDELQFSPARTTRVISAGRQRTTSAFAEDVFMLTPSISLTTALRYDGWRNLDASRNDVALASRSEDAWSPRVAILWKRSEALAFTTSASKAFRAPTLNELYRGFRVGNVVTEANESLGAERMTAFEAGVRYRSVRATAFLSETDDIIGNVTLSTTPALITRQRQNAGSSRSRGIELEGEMRFGRFRASGGYLFTDATLTSGRLAGRRLPQVARHQASVQLSGAAGGFEGAVMSRWASMQFDDDLNELPLEPFVVTDVFVSHALSRGIALTLSVENAFDQRIEAGATPVVTLGTPRSMRAGVRVRL
jgi:outer membrane receptor protein involved in Fe transport